MWNSFNKKGCGIFHSWWWNEFLLSKTKEIWRHLYSLSLNSLNRWAIINSFLKGSILYNSCQNNFRSLCNPLYTNPVHFQPIAALQGILEISCSVACYSTSTSWLYLEGELCELRNWDLYRKSYYVCWLSLVKLKSEFTRYHTVTLIKFNQTWGHEDECRIQRVVLKVVR